MESYNLKTIGELRNVLKKYGYRGYSNMDKPLLVNSVYVAETEHTIFKKFKPNPINFSQFSFGRCNAERYQRFVSIVDKTALKILLFSGLISEIDFKESDVEEYRWISLYTKNSDDIYLHTLIKLRSGFVYIDLSITQNNKINIKIAKDKDYKKIVNNIMTNEQYYWYRHSTELRSQILTVRNTKQRKGSNFSNNVNNLIYLYFKLQEHNHKKIIRIQNVDMNFDMMKNVDTLYWVHLNLYNNDKNYVLYKSKEGIYTLIKFIFNMYKEEDIPKGEIKMVKVYLSQSYNDVIQYSLVHKEYELYMNETN